jgi:hypothetical protein
MRYIEHFPLILNYNDLKRSTFHEVFLKLTNIRLLKEIIAANLLNKDDYIVRFKEPLTLNARR